MPNSKDYRLLLDTKFESLEKVMNLHYNTVDEHFKAVNDKLNEIVTQTTKTNGTVKDHEKFKIYAEGVIASRASATEEQCKRIEAVEGELKEFSKKLEDAMFFVRHPKLFIAGMAVVIILSLATFIETNPFKGLINKKVVEVENTTGVINK